MYNILYVQWFENPDGTKVMSLDCRPIPLF